jgi:hypothetical protein
MGHGWIVMGCLAAVSAEAPARGEPEQYPRSPFVFPVSFPRSDPGSKAMLLLGDLDADGETDYVLLSDGGAAAYGHDGRPLWRSEIPIRYFAGEPGSWVRDDPNAFRPTRADLHGAIADVDGGGANSFVFLDSTGFIVIVLDGRTGRVRHRVDLRSELGEELPFTHVIPGRLFRKDADSGIAVVRHPVHVPFQGKDSLVVFDLERPAGDRSWKRRDLFGICYAPARAIDLDGDGWDEIVTGLEAFDRTGRLLWRVEGRPDQYTTLQVGRVLDAPGLQAPVADLLPTRTGPRPSIPLTPTSTSISQPKTTRRDEARRYVRMGEPPAAG